jgi:hypothetical protein
LAGIDGAAYSVRVYTSCKTGCISFAAPVPASPGKNGEASGLRMNCLCCLKSEVQIWGRGGLDNAMHNTVFSLLWL